MYSVNIITITVVVAVISGGIAGRLPSTAKFRYRLPFPYNDGSGLEDYDSVQNGNGYANAYPRHGYVPESSEKINNDVLKGMNITKSHLQPLIDDGSGLEKRMQMSAIRDYLLSFERGRGDFNTRPGAPAYVRASRYIRNRTIPDDGSSEDYQPATFKESSEKINNDVLKDMNITKSHFQPLIDDGSDLRKRQQSEVSDVALKRNEALIFKVYLQ